MDYLECDSVERLASTDPQELKERLTSVRPEAFVCVNDRAAGNLMSAALDLRYRISGDLSVVGIDGLEYAKLMPVPLTTIQQPCREIGQAAMAAMLDRIEPPSMTTRDILLDCQLVVRGRVGALRSFKAIYPDELKSYDKIHSDSCGWGHKRPAKSTRILGCSARRSVSSH